DEGFLDHVFGLLQVPHDRQRIAEGHVLKAPRHLRERLQVALLGLCDQSLQVHATPSANRCQGPVATFGRSSASEGTTVRVLVIGAWTWTSQFRGVAPYTRCS